MHAALSLEGGCKRGLKPVRFFLIFFHFSLLFRVLKTASSVGCRLSNRGSITNIAAYCTFFSFSLLLADVCCSDFAASPIRSGPSCTLTARASCPCWLLYCCTLGGGVCGGVVARARGGGGGGAGIRVFEVRVSCCFFFCSVRCGAATINNNQLFSSSMECTKQTACQTSILTRGSYLQYHTLIRNAIREIKLQHYTQ